MTSRTAPAPDHEQRTNTHDALPRLDHRSRRRSATLPRPAAGRYLVLDDGDHEAAMLPIDEQIMHIGRGFAADVRLEDASVSRRHAILAQRPNGARILDDRSANGTWVNGRRVGEADLTNGDVIVLGRVILRYVEVV
jgi:pSer/pThr/pTyr-binding forkhead associated (FHA) protein